MREIDFTKKEKLGRLKVPIMDS